MNDTTIPVVLSDWYELTQGTALLQGDILLNSPVFRPPKDMSWPPTNAGIETEFAMEVGTQDVVIMSQSCDLVEQKAEMWLVLLCPLWPLSEAAAVNPILASGFGKEECRRGHMPGYHMMAECSDDRWRREISIVSFREVWSLPLAFVRKFAAASGLRARMRSPYREHLAQAFARYFMRVGLPADIPPFQSQSAEREVMKRLNAMDEETRKRILSAFH